MTEEIKCIIIFLSYCGCFGVLGYLLGAAIEDL